MPYAFPNERPYCRKPVRRRTEEFRGARHKRLRIVTFSQKSKRASSGLTTGAGNVTIQHSLPIEALSVYMNYLIDPIIFEFLS